MIAPEASPFPDPVPQEPDSPSEGDPLDRVVERVSDGVFVDWGDEEFDALASRFGQRDHALRDVARIAAFSRALQREDQGRAPNVPSIRNLGCVYHEAVRSVRTDPSWRALLQKIGIDAS